MPRVRRLALRVAAAALLAIACVPAAFAQSNTPAEAPFAKAASVASLRLAPGIARPTVVAVNPPDAKLIDAVRSANSGREYKRLQIGIGRAVEVPEGSSDALAWQAVPGGFAAQWEVVSPGARALRVGLVAARLAPGTELRFAGSGASATVYGPATSKELAPGGPTYWSPVLEGDHAIVEVFVPGAAYPADTALAVTQVSHLFVSPADPKAESLAKASAGSCEVDLICRSANDPALAQTGRAVARMVFSDGLGGSQYLCTGTLLNPLDNSFTPYFYSAYHCISTQASASTVTTSWFYDATACGSGVTSPLYTQLPGGATLLYADQNSDGLLLRLNATPPSGAVYAGWDASTLAIGTALTAVHHPAGDLKKVSLGSLGGFGNYDTPTLTNYLHVNWNSTATGVTEGGSSGSGIFSFNGSAYLLRGGLKGGLSSCTATPSELSDYYSRLDQVYPAIAAWLNPATGSCSYSLSATSQSLGAAAGSGSFTVTTSAGCAWFATSNASWLGTSSTGSGSGTVTFTVTANSDSTPRTGTLSVGGRTFTVTQAAGTSAGSNAVANPGFESGTASWAQSTTFGTIITNDATNAHTGSWFAWLGGYTSGTDTLYQDIAIPPGTASLRFWYRITTAETTSSTVYDTFSAALVDPNSGATLATVATYSNLDATLGWSQTPPFDVSAYAGRTVRLTFTAVNDVSNSSSFLIDDVALTTSAAPNYTSLWWNPNESGWGLEVNQQGDTAFATLYTYDGSGRPLWLELSSGSRQGTGDVFSGALYSTTGPAFNAVPFAPFGPSNTTQVGTMTLSFSGDTGTLAYSVNGVPVTKQIQKTVFGAQAATCVSTSADRSALANYQDTWWNASEPGWGLHLAQQGSIVFGALFTYDANGRALWLVMSRGEQQADGSFAGDLYSATGPAFNANPFDPAQVNAVKVGTMQLRFSNGTVGTLTYTYNGSAVTKAITRFVFASPVPACSG